MSPEVGDNFEPNDMLVKPQAFLPAASGYSPLMKLNQVTVGTTDYEASVAFYKTLGLKQIVHSPPRYARFETPNGETFSIHEVDEVRSTTIIYFEVENVDAFVAEIDLPLVQGPVDQEWKWREARLLDPSGNEICIYHAGENRRFPPWRVGGKQDGQ